MIIKHLKDIMMIDNFEPALLINTNSGTVNYIPGNSTVVNEKITECIYSGFARLIFRSNQYI